MLHVDIPTPDAVRALADHQGPGCVSVYIPTGVTSDDGEHARIDLKNARDEAVALLQDVDLERGALDRIVESFDDLIDDSFYWSHQSRSLAVFVEDGYIETFRLPNELTRRVDVSDRFLLKPLLRTLTSTQSAFVLALSQNAARLVEVGPDSTAHEVTVPDMPASAASYAGKASIADRSPSGRIQGSEGQKVRMAQYSRGVDQALRPLLSGSGLPLILAAAQPLDAIFRGVSAYSLLLDESIPGNPEELTDQDLGKAARPILDQVNAARAADFADRFETFAARGRAASDLADLARAATIGAVESIAFDIDAVVHGTIDENGALTFDDEDTPENYGVVDEILRRAVGAGASVLAVRADELPTGSPAAAILRYALTR